MLRIEHPFTGTKAVLHFVTPSFQAFQLDSGVRYCDLTHAHEALTNDFLAAQNKCLKTKPRTDEGWLHWRAEKYPDVELRALVDHSVKLGSLNQVSRNEQDVIVKFLRGKTLAMSSQPQPQRVDQARGYIHNLEKLAERAEEPEGVFEAAQPVDVKSLMALFEDPASDVPDIYSMRPDEWTSATLSKFFQRPARGEPGTVSDPELVAVTHFRRNGANKDFLFLCQWKHPSHPKAVIKTWQHWTELFQNIHFRAALARTGWSMKIECEKNFEETDEYLRSLQSDEDVDYGTVEAWASDSESSGSDLEDERVVKSAAGRVAKKRKAVARKKPKKSRSTRGAKPILQYKVKPLVKSKADQAVDAIGFSFD